MAAVDSAIRTTRCLKTVHWNLSRLVFEAQVIRTSSRRRNQLEVSSSVCYSDLVMSILGSEDGSMCQLVGCEELLDASTIT